MAHRYKLFQITALAVLHYDVHVVTVFVHPQKTDCVTAMLEPVFEGHIASLICASLNVC